MMKRVWTAYLVECTKAMRSKVTYIGPVLVVVLVGLAPLIRPLGARGEDAYPFIAYTTPMVLNLLGAFLLLSFCAGLVSSEIGTGTIRLVLTRPLLRHEFILAKLMLGMTYAVLLTVLVVSSTWGIALMFGRLSGVEYGGEVLYTSAEMGLAYGIGAVLDLAPQFAFVAYAVLISTLARNTGTAVAVAIGLWILLNAVKEPLGIGPYLFISYMESPWQVFTLYADGLDATWTPSAYWCLGTSVAAIFVFSAVAMLALHRRNLSA
jgi:ABC-type transport system involved in multi-copper enzyme maturation permease subunit